MKLPLDGLTFDFLAGAMTGHANGVITINIDEANDSRREQTREEMGEPYRTLLGHFRHELGHFYWNKLIQNNATLLNEFREQFGSEANYDSALAAYHERGPAAGWRESFISAYASSHPWEDWAETWAHYMHMLDTLSTAQSFRIARNLDFPIEPFTEPNDPEFLVLLNSWICQSMVVNEMDRAMGQNDSYPFALSKASVKKLWFAYRVGGQATTCSEPGARASGT